MDILIQYLSNRLNTCHCQNKIFIDFTGRVYNPQNLQNDTSYIFKIIKVRLKVYPVDDRKWRRKFRFHRNLNRLGFRSTDPWWRRRWW